MLRRFSRLPGIKIAEDRFGCRGVDAVQNAVMQRAAGFKALHAALRFSFFIQAEHVARIVPKKVGKNAVGTFDGGGELLYLWPQRGFPFSDVHLLQGGDDFFQLSVLSQAERITDIDRAPTEGRDLSACQQIFIKLGKCLQDHRFTSSLSMEGTVRTPSLSAARKNKGRMSAGSE